MLVRACEEVVLKIEAEGAASFVLSRALRCWVRENRQKKAGGQWLEERGLLIDMVSRPTEVECRRRTATNLQR